MRTFVQYVGDPRYPNQTERQIDGMTPWAVGEEREFSEDYVAHFGRSNGADFALLFCDTYNANVKPKLFVITERDDPAVSVPTTDEPAAGATPAASTPTPIDPPTTSPAATTPGTGV